MADRREAILLRLLELLGEVATEIASVTAAATEASPITIDGVTVKVPVIIASDDVYRNRGPLDDDQIPGMILLDGSEETELAKQHVRGGPSTNLMRINPEIYAQLKERKPDRADEYGPEMSLFRNVIYKKVIYDTTLLSLASENGGIVYEGLETDMRSGSTMWGELLMKFSFRYPLIPSEL